MDSTTEARDGLARYVPWIVAGVALAVAVPVGIYRGAAAVVLWLAFALLASALLLFWESLRTLVDPSVPVEDDEDEDARLASLEARKNTALRALKDIAFERSIGRLGEDDYKALEVRYRAEARDAMADVDEGMGPWRAKADALLDAAERRATGAEAPPETSEAPAAQGDATTDEKAADEKPAAEKAADEKPAEAPKGLSCAACGAGNDDDAVFCKKCGARVAKEAADADA